MKRLLLSLLFILFGIVLFGQNYDREQARNYIRKDVEMSRKNLPYTSAYLTVVNAEIKEHGFITYFVIDDTKVNFENAVREFDSNKEARFKHQIHTRFEYTKNLMLSGFNLGFVLRSKKTNKVKVIAYMANDIKEDFFEELKIINSQ